MVPGPGKDPRRHGQEARGGGGGAAGGRATRSEGGRRQDGRQGRPRQGLPGEGPPGEGGRRLGPAGGQGAGRGARDGVPQPHRQAGPAPPPRGGGPPPPSRGGSGCRASEAPRPAVPIRPFPQGLAAAARSLPPPPHLLWTPCAALAAWMRPSSTWKSRRGSSRESRSMKMAWPQQPSYGMPLQVCGKTQVTAAWISNSVFPVSEDPIISTP
mmetsp:Transcript_22538/g.53934  ORF Transcript_22538/g.53934 Transcript_22538/m.53934 type:complete len:212 (+) Transcript_22538:1502-2137(+)